MIRTYSTHAQIPLPAGFYDAKILLLLLLLLLVLVLVLMYPLDTFVSFLATVIIFINEFLFLLRCCLPAAW